MKLREAPAALAAQEQPAVPAAGAAMEVEVVPEATVMLAILTTLIVTCQSPAGTVGTVAQAAEAPMEATEAMAIRAATADRHRAVPCMSQPGPSC